MSYQKTFLQCSKDGTITSQINIIGSEYTTTNKGHVKITANTSVGVSTFECDITNNNGNLPALYLNYNGAIQMIGHGTICSCGTQIYFSKPTGFSSISESNVTSTNWYGVGGSYPIGTIFDRTLVGMAQYVPGDNRLNVFTIESNIPIFMDGDIESVSTYGTSYTSNNTSTYGREVCEGNLTNINKARNYVNIADSIPNNKVYDIINYLKVDGIITQTKAYCFKILPNAKIGLYVDERINGDSSPNMILRISNYPCKYKGFYQPDSSYADVSVVDSNYWWGEWTNYDDGTSYVGYGATNIPIFRSATELQAYFDGDIGEDASINGGSSSIQTSTIGQGLNSTDIPTVNLSTSGVGCYIYALSESEIKNLMSNYLYVTNQQDIENISNGLWLWGNNPIDFFIDCYYIPFDITNFYTTVNADMKFGTYRFESSQGWATFPVVQETNGQRLTLFNTTFEGMYGDWRDYNQFEYDLYLPFFGFFKLDLFKYLNHSVKCEMMFDVTTHNLRYYLYVDGIITDRIDSSVGINLPLMSSDMVNKAKSDRQAKRDSDRTAYKAIGSFLTGGLAVAGGIASGNASYAVNGGISGITSVIDAKFNLDALADKVHENATQSVEGAFSSSMNIYDIRYAYLRITERELVIPDKIHELYNYPSYYMGSASALSGYCEISDIRLKSFTGTIEELNALKGALREGVIL